jgi:3-oxoacyl-[acyl-carrier-protein] synthase III
MIGIKAIAVYLPEKRASNLALMEKFEVDEPFLKDKIGVLSRTIKGAAEDTSDMAVKALELLLSQTGLSRDSIELLVVVTQNPDTNLPHVSALVHGKANLSLNCAAFDLSLGCSGYVYGLSVAQSFMSVNALTCGVLVTCDPYSKIVQPDDKNTVLLFGDAATATLLGPDPIFECGPFTFGTQGDLKGALVCKNGTLEMNGRDIFNFAASVVPKSIENLLEKSGKSKSQIDCFLLHQGSKYIVSTIGKRLSIDGSKLAGDIISTGNTVSSTIPIILERMIDDDQKKLMILSGFGVGLSWASCLCKRKEN